MNTCCQGGWLCAKHRKETADAWNRRQREIALAVKGLKARTIDKICARYELESDEFQTAEQKAEGYIRRGER